ncbi:MAG TPA: hypothetical protein VEB22_13535 [Phycisphaerales bacterium]|nr:hypothetical protein [Phycisphaerales bacterium]
MLASRPIETDTQPSVPLSGRVYFVPHQWAAAETEKSANPRIGDLRLAVTVDHDARIVTTDESIGRGRVVASFFDGLCWRRFDVASLTRNTAFEGRDQLSAVLRWTERAAREAAGRACTSTVPDGAAFPLWSLGPAVTLPQRTKAPKTGA